MCYVIIIIIIIIMLLRWSVLYTSDQQNSNINTGGVYAATNTYRLHDRLYGRKILLFF